MIFAFSLRFYTLVFPSMLNRAWIFAWTSLQRGQLATTVFGGDLPWRELEIRRKIRHSEEWLVNCYVSFSIFFLSFFPSFFYLFLTWRPVVNYELWIVALEVKFVSSIWQKLTLSAILFTPKLKISRYVVLYLFSIHSLSSLFRLWQVSTAHATWCVLVFVCCCCKLWTKVVLALV